MPHTIALKVLKISSKASDSILNYLTIFKYACSCIISKLLNLLYNMRYFAIFTYTNTM